MSKYVISGASGKIGRRVAEQLLKAGHNVTVISRSPDNVSSLETRGAVVASGNTNDVGFLKKTLTGADAFFALVPVNAQSKDHQAEQVTHVKAFTEALRGSSIRHVVGISSIGVTLPEKWGIVYGLHVMEEALNEIPELNTMFLRGSYFMENSLGLIPGIKKFGKMFAPIDPSLSFPVVSTGDIATRAVEHLKGLSFHGKNVENALGPQFITYPEVARVYGAAIGKPELAYQQVGMDDFKNALISIGMSQNIADNYAEFTTQMNQGLVYQPGTQPTPETTPTDIAQFSTVFASVYNNS